MPLNVSCPTCGHRLAVPDEFAGEIFRCKQCNQPFRVAAPAAPQHAPAQQAQVAVVPVAHEGGDPRSVRFNCPRCNSSFETPAAQAGTKFFCTTCGQKVQVPDPPPNRTMLGNVDDDPRNRTTLGSLAPPGAYPPPAHVPAQPPPYAPQYDPRAAGPPAYSRSPYYDEPPPRPRRRRRWRRRYDDEYEGQGGGASMALGITSMILGIIALPFAIFPCLGFFLLPIAGLGVVLGLIGLTVGSGDPDSQPGLSITGLVTSGIAIVMTIVWLVALPDFWGRRMWWRL